MPRILIRCGSLQAALKNVLGNADEGSERAVIQCVRQCVARIQVHIFTGRLVQLQRSSVIDGISSEIVTTDQTRRVARNSAVIILTGWPARRRRTRRRAGIRPGRNPRYGTKVAYCGTQQVMRGDKQVAGTNGKA